MTRFVYDNCTHLGTRQILKQRRYDSGVVSEVVYEPGLIFDRHYHDQPNLGIVLRGACFHQMAKAKEQKCVPGEIHYLPPGEPHSLRFYDKAHCVGLAVGMATLERLSDFANFEFKTGNQVGETFHNLGQRLVQEFKQDDDASPLTIECLILEILVQMGRARRLPNSRPTQSLSRVRELMHDGMSEPLSLSDIARQIGMHPAHLAREFRKAFNCTMGEYLRNIRIQEALTILEKSDAPLSEIGQLCGFYDQSHFSRCFKRIVGVSPQAYKKRISY